MTLRERLGRRRLLVVTGKGGVGKSAFAAALGRILSGFGRRVLILEVDPRESLYQLLGSSPSGGDVVRIGPALYFQNLDPGRVADEIVRESLRVEALSRRVLASPVYRHFVDGAPGLKEVAVLTHATRALDRLRGADGKPIHPADIVVLDAPASGHAVTLLAAPLRVSEVIRHGPVGRMAEELARLVRDPERCGIVVVTAAEEMPVQESIELLDVMRADLGREPEAVAFNALYPPFPGNADSPDDPARSLWRDRRSVNERERARLRKRWSGPCLDLPLLAEERGPDLVRTLREPLEAALDRSVEDGP